MKFEWGTIDNGEYAGLCVIALAECMRQSSWDFPSFVIAIGLDHLFTDGEPTMWPTRDDARIIANAIDLDDDEAIEKFVDDFPLTWDT